MRTRSFFFSAALVVVMAVLVLAAGACKKHGKAGDPCKTEWSTDCTDKKDALVCVSGKLEALACRSINGCMDMGDGNDDCSNETQMMGEPCKDEGNYSCSIDAKEMLKCDSKHWIMVDDCKGQNGCQSSASGAKCDKGTETAGASCSAQNEGNGSCSPDGKSLLMCRSGKMVLAATCKGLNGCRQRGTDLDCNQTVADIGDPCFEGKYACSTDRKTRLQCRSGKMAKDRTCNKSCSVMIEEVQCQ
jgi:hypothetical protein